MSSPTSRTRCRLLTFRKNSGLGLVAAIFKRQYADIVARQLAMFDQEQAYLLGQTDQALRQYHAASDEGESLEHYGSYDDLSEDLEDLLEDTCRRYADTMAPGERGKYIRQFERAALRRYGELLSRRDFLSDL